MFVLRNRQPSGDNITRLLVKIFVFLFPNDNLIFLRQRFENFVR